MVDLDRTWCYATRENYHMLAKVCIGYWFPNFSERESDEDIMIIESSRVKIMKFSLEDIKDYRRIFLSDGEFHYVDEAVDVARQTVVKARADEILEQKDIDNLYVKTPMTTCKSCGHKQPETTQPFKCNSCGFDEENLFNVNGFKAPDFQAEILGVVDGYLIGYFHHPKFVTVVPCRWSLETGKGEYSKEFYSPCSPYFDLYHIEELWWQKPENLGKAIVHIHTGELGLFRGVEDGEIEVCVLSDPYGACKGNLEDFRMAEEVEIIEKLLMEEG